MYCVPVTFVLRCCNMQNLKLAQNVFRVAERKGCTPGQLALAWLLHKGDDVVPIPGRQVICRRRDSWLLPGRLHRRADRRAAGITS